MADADRIARKVSGSTMGLCRTRDLVEAGASWNAIARRVEREVWARPHHGIVDTTLQAWTWPRRVLAAVLSCPVGTVASFRTAGGLYDLPGVERGGRIEVTTPRSGRTRDVQFTVHSTMYPDSGTSRGGVPCTRPVRTAVDLARCLGDRPYARIVRELLRRGAIGAGDVHDQTLARLPGHARFAATVETEWDLARLPTESPLEDDVVDWLVRRGLRGFVTQHAVRVPDVAGSNDGEEPQTVAYRLDIAWPERRVAVSVVGARWHADALAREADRIRRENLAAAGWTVVEVRADDLHGAAALSLERRIARAVSV